MQLETIKARVLDRSIQWYNRAHLIYLYHSVRAAQPLPRKWTMRDTSKALGISLGSVHNYLRLQEALEANPELKKLSFRKALGKK